MAVTWSGPVASYGKLTGDRRMFEQMGDLDSRTLPVPLRYSPTGGHEDAVDIGGVTNLNLASNPIQGSGFFLPAEIEPLVTPALFKAKAGINGPSLDMDNFQMARKDGGPDGRAFLAMRGRVMAITLVSTPAFADQRLDINEGALTAGAWEFHEVTDETAIDLYDTVLVAAGVNASAWLGLPVAPRDAAFRVEDAIQRIKQWAGGDVGKYAKAFLWQDPNIDPADMRAYRLPVGDIIDGKLTMIYHAVYAGAALIQGAHGGLPSIPDADKGRLRTIIDRMYKRMSQDFSEDLEPPWDQGAKNRPLSMGWDSPSEVEYETDQLITMENGDVFMTEGIVAGGGPLAPPKSIFDNPNLQGKLGHEITEDRLVRGYVAHWGVCHTGVGNVCVEAPKSKTNYNKFHQGHVLTAEGDLIKTGKITMAGGHADTKLGMVPAIAHYDNTTTAVAVVRAGEDEHGIWYAGMLMPGVTEQQIFELRASPLSGDWRRDQKVQNLELIAALAVNDPGFPLAEVASGEQQSLIAAGVVLSSGDEYTPDEADVADQVVVAATEAEETPAEVLDPADDRKARLAAILAADQARRAKRLSTFQPYEGE